MKAKSSPKKKGLQRLKFYKPLFPRSKKTKRVSRKSWRVKSYSFQITSRLRLEVKLRTFKTAPDRRSKKKKQFVVRLGVFGITECACSYIYRKNTRNSHHDNLLLKPQASTVFMSLSLLGLAFFGFQITGIGQAKPPLVSAQSGIVKPVEAQLEPEAKQPYLLSSQPTRVQIPGAAVDAEIHEVGLLENGEIETPDLFSGKVGWYKYGPTPGELGPSVLIGHVDNYKGPSVFWNLSNLTVGDIVDVTRADGTQAQFSVTRITQYDQKSFKTDEVYGNIDYAGLRIITCGGAFNHLTGRYSHNTVVFATLVL